MSKLEKIRLNVLSMDTLTNNERETLLSIIDSKDSIWIKILKIIKYLGAVAGFVLAGIGANAMTSFINI